MAPRRASGGVSSACPARRATGLVRLAGLLAGLLAASSAGAEPARDGRSLVVARVTAQGPQVVALLPDRRRGPLLPDQRTRLPAALCARTAGLSTCAGTVPDVHLAPGRGFDAVRLPRQNPAALLRLAWDPAHGGLQVQDAEGRTATLPPVLAPPPLGELQTLVAEGVPEHGYDVVFVSDGFAEDERKAFFAAAAQVAAGWLAEGAYAHYAGHVRSHALFVASAQSGADHPAQGHHVDTAFDTTFEYGGIERLAVADDAKVLAAVAAAMPDFDLAVVLVNDPAYGGSGGEVPVVSMDPDAVRILRHELGHTIAGLADEYDAGGEGWPAIDPEPNVATAQHLQPPKWQAWLEPGTPLPTPIELQTGPATPIGAYEGARYKAKGVFRPAPQCLMRSLDHAFCPICAEAVVLALADRTVTLRGRQPHAAQVTCTPPGCPSFEVATAPLVGLQVRWLRDGVEVGAGPQWTPGAAHAGTGTLTVQVRDPTALVRSDPHTRLHESTQWALTVLDPGLDPAPDPADAACGDCADGAEAPEADPQPGRPRRDDGCAATRSAHGPATSALVLLALAAGACARGRRRREPGGTS